MPLGRKHFPVCKPQLGRRSQSSGVKASRIKKKIFSHLIFLCDYFYVKEDGILKKVQDVHLKYKSSLVLIDLFL